jgi:hypothetical protein
MNSFAKARALFMSDFSGFALRHGAHFCLAKACGISNNFAVPHANLADTRTCVYNSPIQLVWAGTGSGGSSGSGGGGSGLVTVSSGSPAAGNLVAIQ